MGRERIDEAREARFNMDPIADHMEKSMDRMKKIVKDLQWILSKGTPSIEDRIAYLVEKHPGMNCYLLALILKSEFEGEIWYDMDHCVFVSNYGFPYDKTGRLNDLNKRMAPVSTYGDEIVDELIKSVKR